MSVIRPFGPAPADEPSRPVVYLACPYWMRNEDLVQAVRIVASDELKLGINLVYPEAETISGNLWEAKKEAIARAKWVVARPDLKNALFPDRRDLDVYMEVGFALALGRPVTWLLHPDEEQLPFLMRTHEAVITGNVIDATMSLRTHLEKAQVASRVKATPDRSSVFFSAPYTDASVNRFEIGIATPLRSHGFSPFFAKQALAPGDAVEQTLDKIRCSSCVVADVSERSPNVAFEIGYAMGLEKSVVLIRHFTSPLLDGNLGGFSSVEFESSNDLADKMARLGRSL